MPAAPIFARVAGRPGRDAVGRCAQPPHRRRDRRRLRGAAGAGRRLPPVVRRLGRDRPAADRGGAAARPADRLAGPPRRVAHASPRRRSSLLVAASLAQMLFLLCAQKGLLLVADRNGVSRLLEYWSPSWRLWSLAPSFLMQAPADRLGLHRGVAGRARRGGVARSRGCGGRCAPGAAGLAACGVAGGAVAAGVRPRARRMLDRWRAPAPAPGARAADGAALRLRRATAAARRRLRSAAARARRRRFRRCSPSSPAPTPAASAPASICSTTPAGRCPPAATSSTSTAAAARSRARSACRSGASARRCGTWTIAPGAALDDDRRPARQRPLRRVPRLAGAGRAPRPELRLIPRAVPDLRTRRTDPDVMQSRQYGDAAVFFYDERVEPEPTGFWTRGDSSSRLAVDAGAGSPDGAAAARRARAGDRDRPRVDGDVAARDAGAGGDARRSRCARATRSRRSTS